MKGPFSVRVTSAENASAVTALLKASYTRLLAEDYEPGVLAKALPLLTRANSELLAAGTFYVAQSETGQLVGCGGWSKWRPGSHETSPGMAYIRHFATHPDWLRRGIGRVLLARCLQGSREQGAQILECHSSFGAVKFYEACGFVVVRPIDMQLTVDISLPGKLMRFKFSD